MSNPMIEEISVRKIQVEDIPKCGAVLRRLPQWFGTEESILEYEVLATTIGLE